MRWKLGPVRAAFGMLAACVLAVALSPPAFALDGGLVATANTGGGASVIATDEELVVMIDTPVPLTDRFELPATGGTGTGGLYLAGAGSVLFGLSAMALQKRRSMK